MKPQQHNGTIPRIRAAMSLYESRGITVDEEKNTRKKENTSTLKDSTRERASRPGGVLWEEQLLET
jgi:hypothetical protein